jgi:DNA gyrase subunit A
MQTIRKAGRNTSGVIIVNVDAKDKVVSVAKCPKEDDDELDIESADTMDGINLDEYNLKDRSEENIVEDDNILNEDNTLGEE